MKTKKQYRADFVREFGNLFPKYGAPNYEGLGVKSMEYVKENRIEYVIIHWTGGETRWVNVTYDSLGAIVLDVMRQIL